MQKKVIKTDLASIKIVEDLFEEGRQFLQKRKEQSSKMSAIAAQNNKEAAKLAQKMERAAKDLERTAKAIGMDIDNDLPEIGATLKIAEKVAELQNAYARIAMAITKELD